MISTAPSARDGASSDCQGVYESTIRLPSMMTSVRSFSGSEDAARILDDMLLAYEASVSPPPPLVTKTKGIFASVTFCRARRPSFDHSRPYLKTPSMSKAMATRASPASASVRARLAGLDILAQSRAEDPRAGDCPDGSVISSCP